MDLAADADSDEAKIQAWIEAQVGPVRKFEREARWRPAWLVEAEVNGQTRKLYVRGDRKGDFPPRPLRYEADIHELFEKSGVRVPHYYGYIEEPAAIVMELVEGHISLSEAETETERAAVRRQLIAQMVSMHEVSTAAVEAAGAPGPDDPADLPLTHYRAIEQIYLRHKKIPMPGIEFVRSWIERNVPANPEGPRTISVDSGQFMFKDGELLALRDFEFVCLGDFHTDLAALRLRNLQEYIGEMSEICSLYEELSGLRVDPHRLRYHTVVFCIVTPLMTANDINNPKAGHDQHEYMIWASFCLKFALECIAEIMGIELEPLPSPEPEPTRYDIAQQALELHANGLTATDEYSAYQRRKQILALRFLRRVDRHQPAFERRYLADVAAITGRPVSSWAEADRVIEDFVTTAGPESDAALLRLFHRHSLEACFLLADPEDKVNWVQLTAPLRPFP